MKFIVDAQLPRRIATWLRVHGHDALHTLDLPDEDRTTDAEIVAPAARDERVVVTKDADFIESFILHHQPDKLLVIATGNISNVELVLQLGYMCLRPDCNLPATAPALRWHNSRLPLRGRWAVRGS